MQCRSRPSETVIRRRTSEAGVLAIGLLGGRPSEGADLATQLIEAQALARRLKHIHPAILKRDGGKTEAVGRMENLL